MIKIEEKEAHIFSRGANYSIAYLQGPPRGQALLYLHGLGSTKEDFLGAFDSPLFREYTLLAFDFPGSGKSSYPEGLEVAMLDLVEITNQLISQMGLNDLTLIGHSMGGLVGLLYTDTYPEQVRRFINIEGNLAPEDCAVFSRQSVGYPSRGREEEYFKRVVEATACVEQAGYREFARSFGSQVEPRAFFGYCRSIVTYSDHRHLLDLFTRLSCPKLFIHGAENSSLTYIPQLRREGVLVASLADSSHFPVTTNPSELFRTIAEFVESESTRPDNTQEAKKGEACLGPYRSGFKEEAARDSLTAPLPHQSQRSSSGRSRSPGNRPRTIQPLCGAAVAGLSGFRGLRSGIAMQLALIQPTLSSDLGSNLTRSLELMEVAAEREANVVSFPELQLSPFFPQFEGRDASEFALTLEDEVIQKLRRKCAELHLIAFPNIYLQEGEALYDATLAIGSDGSILGISKMVHVVQAKFFFEQDYYTPSDTGFQVYDTPVGRIGVVICFDRHFPESFRTCVLKGAQLILVPTVNTKDEPLEMFDWEMRVSAMQNGVFIAMCNRTGIEHEMHFSGGSIVIGPDGEVLARAGEREEILLAEVDLAAIDRARAVRPYLNLRRPAAFE